MLVILETLAGQHPQEILACTSLFPRLGHFSFLKPSEFFWILQDWHWLEPPPPTFLRLVQTTGAALTTPTLPPWRCHVQSQIHDHGLVALQLPGSLLGYQLRADPKAVKRKLRRDCLATTMQVTPLLSRGRKMAT